MIDAPAYGPVLNRLDGRIAAEIARLRLRYQLSLDEFRGLYVSDEQVDGLLRADARFEPRSTDPESPLAPGDDVRWRHVARCFALSALELDVVALALAPEIDLKYETLFAYLNDDVTRKWLTANLAVRLLGDRWNRNDVLSALSPGSPLCRNRLIAVLDAPSARPSLLNAGYSIAAPLSRFLQGIQIAAPPSADLFDEPVGADDNRTVEGFATLLRRDEIDPPALVLVGGPGAGRMRAAASLARRLAMPLRLLDLRATRREGIPIGKAIETIALEAALEKAIVCVSGIRAAIESDGRLPQELHGALAACAGRAAPLVLLAASGVPWHDLLGGRRALVADLSPGDPVQQQRVWSEQLARAGFALTDAECRALADRFHFTPAQVANAVATARDWQTLGDGVSGDASLVRDAARAQAREPLGQLARIDRSRFGWNDLVLPPTVLARLKELGSAIRLRHVVYNDWGFGVRFSGGRGVKAMFAGPSGTGKTMAAGVIAAEVGLDLIKVDLSGLVSKYIGDTEKNLDRVFAGARSGNALLFFDEADAIFGKRSEVKDAHDRYANIEVAYLLQKIEDHDGVVFLATNLRRNIDEAFSRRLHYVVDFPAPDVGLRERLWHGMFPSNAPVANDVDFGFLARQFELAGGDIRNVVLDAAFLAADGQGVIAMKHLVRALARQMAKQGRTPSASEFQRYFELASA